MKTKFCMACALLLMSVTILSCNKNRHEKIHPIDPVLNNHFVVDKTITPIEGLMVSYHKSSSDKTTNSTKVAYPLDIHLYGSRPHFKDLSNQNFELIENSAPMIHFKLYTSTNGKPDLGNYVWDKNSTEAGYFTSVWHAIKRLTDRVTNSGILISTYEQVAVSKPNLRINKVGNEVYEFIFDAADYNGSQISGYYKGRISLTQISSQD